MNENEAHRGRMLVRNVDVLQRRSKMDLRVPRTEQESSNAPTNKSVHQRNERLSVDGIRVAACLVHFVHCAILIRGSVCVVVGLYFITLLNKMNWGKCSPYRWNGVSFAAAASFVLK